MYPNLPYTSPVNYPIHDLPPVSLRNVEYSSNIARPVYNEPHPDVKSHSPPNSPTASAITENIVHELNVLEK